MSEPALLPLRVGDSAQWATVTCFRHSPEDIEVRHEGATTSVRCRQCVRERDRLGDLLEP
jgi:hypothetical protein